jgi:hypothetical protein
MLVDVFIKKVIIFMKKNVFILTTPYHFFLAYLFVFQNKLKDVVFIFADHTEAIVRIYNKFKECDKISSFFVPEYEIRRTFKRMYSNSITRRINKNKHVKSIFINFNNLFPCDLYLNDERNLIAHYSILMNKKYFYIEDGVGAYVPLSKLRLLEMKISELLKYRYSIDGYGDFAERVYVRHPEKLPKEKKHKAIFFDYDQVLNKMMDSDIIEMLSYFNTGNIDGLDSEQKTLLLITQPLRDELLSEGQKIAIYKKILDNYKDYKVFIKPHPREKTDYTSHFNATMIDRNLPAEVLDLAFKEKSFDLGLTLFSTGLIGVKNVKDKIFLIDPYLPNKEKLNQLKRYFSE